MGSNTPSQYGNFSYPPPGSSLVFNYIDSLVTSWLIFDSDPTDCLLSIWIWPNVDPWKIGYNRTVPANSSTPVPLNLDKNGFLAQLNFNYHASDGSHPRILGPIFTVDNSPRSSAVTWSQGVLAAPTSSASAVSQTSPLLTLSASTASAASSRSSISEPLSTSGSHGAIAAVTLTASAALSSPSVSKSSTTNNSGLGAGAIAGIVVGIVVSVGLAAAFVFYRRRKSRKIKTGVKTQSSAHVQSRNPVHFIGEKDATPLQPSELSGDGQRVEMATTYHGEMNVSTGRA